MARNFTTAPDDIALAVADGVQNDVPSAVIGWFKTASVSGNRLLIQGGGDFPHNWVTRVNASGQLDVFWRDGSSNLISGVGSTAYNDGAWHWFMCVRRSATDFEAYVDGVSQFTDTTNVGTITLTVLRFGNANAANTWDGDLAEIMFLTRAPSVTEAEWIAKVGMSLSKKRHWPLWGVHSPEINIADGGGNSGALTGTTKSNHPPTVPFSKRWWKATVPLIEVAAGRIMGPLAGHGGLAGPGGIAGRRGGIAG